MVYGDSILQADVDLGDDYCRRLARQGVLITRSSAKMSDENLEVLENQM
jgi:hypothetical protein